MEYDTVASAVLARKGDVILTYESEYSLETKVRYLGKASKVPKIRLDHHLARRSRSEWNIESRFFKGIHIFSPVLHVRAMMSSPFLSDKSVP